MSKRSQKPSAKAKEATEQAPKCRRVEEPTTAPAGEVAPAALAAPAAIAPPPAAAPMVALDPRRAHVENVNDDDNDDDRHVPAPASKPIAVSSDSENDEEELVRLQKKQTAPVYAL
ncbi:hypothetical protein PsYK624_164270 [Phanerochaete sordida]|uniref:Uncharacterized protein n=1 Tax=Phanerochaete sordida TaxID=48140 RepID=A0A9P3GRF7_9APHY|nr:hypothetical protein PsYK624_164270 [Phanerochaete sordida]